MGIICCCCCRDNEVEPEDNTSQIQEVPVEPVPVPKPKPKVTSRLKLIYFPLNGSAEHIRLIFVTAGVRYDEEALPDKEWTELKPTVPLGEQPLLEVNGRVMAQPTAIARFVAAHCGLDCSVRQDAAFAEGLVDSVVELRTAGMAVAGLDINNQAKVEFCKRLLVPRLKTFEQLLKKREYFVINRMTYADVVVFSVLDQLRHADTAFDTLIKKVLIVVEFMKRLAKHPNISKYLQDSTRYPMMKKYVRKVSVTSEVINDVADAADGSKVVAIDDIGGDSDEYKRLRLTGNEEAA